MGTLSRGESRGDNARARAIAFVRRAPRQFLGLALALGIVAGIKLNAWLRSPERKLQQFAGNIQQGDAAGMLALMDRAEVERLGLTPGKLAAMLADAAGSPAGVTVTEFRWEPLNEEQSLYNRWATLTLKSRDGRPLKDARAATLKVIVQAHNTDDGWKIGGSNFIVAVLAARTGFAFRRGYYAALCARHGVPPEVLAPENGTWETAPNAR